MNHSRTDEARRWKAPAGDGEILVWPDARGLVASIHDNQKRLEGAQAVRIANVPMPELRREHRAWIGHANHEQPLIAAGHQIELYHPGVWAKNVLIHELAAATGGQAYHVALDTDAPKHLHLRWPGESLPITDDPRLTSAAWSGSLLSPTPRHVERMTQSLEAASRKWPFRPLALSFLANLRRLTVESQELTSSLTNAIHDVEWQLGLRHHALLAAPIWQSPAYLAFVYHILANAESFAHAYNGALAAYRRDNAIRNVGRPWPDLRVTREVVEVPFWFDSLAPGTRWRAGVVRKGERFAMREGDGNILAFDPALDAHAAAAQLAGYFRAHSLRLSPRAMTLTCFLRLFMADQFVHGIGGARYDQVTDQVIARWFGLQPPAFSVTTATLLFPGAVDGQRVDVQALAREGRRLRHGWDLPQKREVVKQIVDLPRGSIERSRLYYEMHNTLDELAQAPQYEQWQRRYEQAKSVAQEQSVLDDRELFFAIQPEERLKMLMAKYHDAVARATSP